MYSEKLEKLINLALADGVLTEKEKQVLFRNAEAEGIDSDEFEMVLDARLYEKQQAISSPEVPSPTLQSENLMSEVIEKGEPVVLENEFTIKLHDIYYKKILKRIELYRKTEDIHAKIKIMDAKTLETEYNITIKDCFDYLISSTKNSLTKSEINYIKKKEYIFLSNESKVLFNALKELDNSGKNIGNSDKQEQLIIDNWNTTCTKTLKKFDILWGKLCYIFTEISEKTSIIFGVDYDVYVYLEKAIKDPIEEIIINELIVDDRSFYVLNEIPLKKRINAEDSYVNLDLDENEKIICLYDSTLLGNSKEGICLTNKAIYWKVFSRKGIRFCYKNIETIKTENNHLYINGLEVKTCPFNNILKKTINKIIQKQKSLG
jgi:hypothetical protein